MGQIYHKQKIHEILNCDMIQAFGKRFLGKNLTFLIPNLKF